MGGGGEGRPQQSVEQMTLTTFTLLLDLSGDPAPSWFSSTPSDLGTLVALAASVFPAAALPPVLKLKQPFFEEEESFQVKMSCSVII